MMEFRQKKVPKRNFSVMTESQSVPNVSATDKILFLNV